MFGLAIFLGFLLLSVQILVHLYATSAVTAAAYDAARMVAGHETTAIEEAEEHAQGLLGDYGSEAVFDWSGTTEAQVVLRVTAPTPARMIEGLAGAIGLDGIERTVHVRVEDPR